MKIVRNAVLKESKKIPIIMICISVLILILCFVNINIDFSTDAPIISIETFNIWSSVISLFPLTWAICTALLIKTKKVIFSKMPSYIICSIVLLALILYYIASGNGDVVSTILVFAVAVLLVYPFIIATLTIEGRMYNRVFATVFSVMLMTMCVIAAIVLCVVLKTIMVSVIIPALIYLELTLAVFCYDLEKINKTQSDEKSNIITH